MTANEFRYSLDALGVTQAQAAKWMDLSLRTIHGYCNGRTIPRVVEFALAAMAADTNISERTKRLKAVRSSRP